ncbi:hypothetical protein Nepgr_022244 [Nepenthes gracilis]|uniref:Uncharacterized protein n=1 Tax=Nepenthes gracilis TaxID=150966 RepID=A0AAD3SYD8_NEPGR|nr:hypothetical protein Nepgr_022244 [Nepenthes gracilis]
MSEYCFLSSTKNKFYGLILSDFVLLCSFILSHPLYFSYFIFFSPYIFKLFSFLSPLFITTVLLLLSLATAVVPGGSKEGYLLKAYSTISEKLSCKTEEEEDEELEQLEELEVYKIVFGAAAIEVGEIPENFEEKSVQIAQKFFEMTAMEENPVRFPRGNAEGKSEKLTCNAKSIQDVQMNSNSDKVKGHKQESTVRRGSEAMEDGTDSTHLDAGSDKGAGYTSLVKENMQREDENGGKHCLRSRSDSRRLIIRGPRAEGDFSEDISQTPGVLLGSCGSMRKEREWRRTLACKLFEERHNASSDGGERMDLLWEAYEKESSSKIKNGKESKVQFNGVRKEEDDDGEEEEDEEEENRQLCCLQALKFSTGKMSLGMGRPNLVRISKAVKGIGWLRHLSRHGKRKMPPLK